ncbi:putative secologanin synthase [Helianthus annuus]|nr:putative secologanin synthase [Helianthus annuus]
MRTSIHCYHRSKIFSKTCFTWVGTRPLVHISEPAMIREVLANYNTYQKPRGGNPLIKLLVRGLVDLEGEQWVKHRKIINPAFHMEKLKVTFLQFIFLLQDHLPLIYHALKTITWMYITLLQHMIPAFYVSCSEMIGKWDKLLTQESSCEVDVWPYLQTFSSDVISRTAFGSSFKEGRKIFELQREQARLVMKAINSVYIPGTRFLPTQDNKRMKEINQQVKGSIKSIINKRVVAMKAGDAGHDDLLGILLDSNYKEIKQKGNSNFGLSIDDVIEECKLFYFAGQETTGNMLVWTMILLAQHSEWQTRAREEVLHVFGDKKPDIDGLTHSKVINIIFNEVLRLYSPAASFRRLIHDESKLGNLTLPAGTLIQINVLIVHHDKDTWGEDANDFNPQRFSEGVSKVTKGQAAYLPFGGGPRICIGQNFAMLEAKMALAMILQRFSFELSPSYSHAPYAMPTLQPQFGAHLILHKH